MSDTLLHTTIAYILLTIICFDRGFSEPATWEHQHDTDRGESFDIVYPTRLDSEGRFLSHSVHFVTPESSRKKRDVDERVTEHADERLFYSLPFEGKRMTLNLTKNSILVPDNFLIERFEEQRSVNEAVVSSFSAGTKRPCHFRGHVAGHPESKVALSTCHGLTGFISTAEGDFLLEPVETQMDNSDDRSQPHKMYRHDVSTFVHKAEPMLDIKISKRKKSNVTQKAEADTPTHESAEFPNDLPKDYCGVVDSKRRYRRIVNKRHRWESRHGHGARSRSVSFTNFKRRNKRSVSEERLIEMLVVADKTMVDFYDGSDQGGVERYVLTIVNMDRCLEDRYRMLAFQIYVCGHGFCVTDPRVFNRSYYIPINFKVEFCLAKF